MVTIIGLLSSEKRKKITDAAYHFSLKMPPSTLLTPA